MMFKIRSEKLQAQAAKKVPKTGMATYKVARVISEKLCQSYRLLIKTLISSMTVLGLARSANVRAMISPALRRHLSSHNKLHELLIKTPAFLQNLSWMN
jgi:hypothetical protein